MDSIALHHNIMGCIKMSHMQDLMTILYKQVICFVYKQK